MITMTQRTRIPASAERLWEFFEHLDENYEAWHPEHLRWRTIRGKPLHAGTVWFGDEWVGPLRVASRFFITDHEPGSYFAYRVGFPARLIGTGGSFRLEAEGDGDCELIETVHLGYSAPVFGWLLDLAIRVFLPLAEFRRHIREEGESLVGIFEAQAAST